MAAITKQTSPRVISIDIARSLAILLAMGSHAWAVAHGREFFEGTSVDVLRLLMALATPTFIMLFGTMLEIVYRPRFQPGNRRNIAARLLSRSIQCWLLYSLSVAVLFFMRPEYSLMFSLSTVMMLGATPFTDILKFYALVLAFSPILLWLRAKYGLLALIVTALLVHLLHPMIQNLPSPDTLGMPKEIDKLAMFLAGIGNARLGGPSVLHGITLVICGMVLGRILTGTADVNSRARYVLAGTALVIAIIGLFIDWETIISLGNMEMRMDNHPGYFLFGILGACLLTTVSILLAPPSETTTKIAFLGRTSLFVFAFGNMLLYAVVFDAHTTAQSVGLAIVLLAAIVAMSFWFDRESRHGGMIENFVANARRYIDLIANRAVNRAAHLLGRM